MSHITKNNQTSKREKIKIAEIKLQECKEAFFEMLDGDVYMEDDTVANIFKQADDEIKYAYERHPETSENVSNKVYIIIHEYMNRDHQGCSVLEVKTNEEEALERAKEFAYNEIRESSYDENDIFYHDNGVIQEINYSDGYYDLFKVEVQEVK